MKNAITPGQNEMQQAEEAPVFQSCNTGINPRGQRLPCPINQAVQGLAQGPTGEATAEQLPVRESS
jgi:hypothetical protein